MKAALIIGGLGVVLVVMTPTLRTLRFRSASRMTNDEYFAAARKRAISYRLAKSASNQVEKNSSRTD